MKLARIAVDRPVTIYMFFLAVLLLGVVSLRELSVDLLPDISYPRLSVVTHYTGVAPEEIETLITAPLESAVSRIPGLRRVESVSKEGVSLLTLEFDWGTNMDFTMLHAREQLDNASDRLPEDAENPTIIPLDPQSQPIMTLACRATGASSSSRSSPRSSSSRGSSRSRASARPRSRAASSARSRSRSTRRAGPLRADRRRRRQPHRRLQPQPPGRDDPQGDVQIRPPRRRRVRVAGRDRRDRPPVTDGARRRPAPRRRPVERRRSRSARA